MTNLIRIKSKTVEHFVDFDEIRNIQHSWSIFWERGDGFSIFEADALLGSIYEEHIFICFYDLLTVFFGLVDNCNSSFHGLADLEFKLQQCEENPPTCQQANFRTRCPGSFCDLFLK